MNTISFIKTISNVSFGPTKESYLVPLSIVFPPHTEGVFVDAEDENFPMVEEIILQNEKFKSDFTKAPEGEPEICETAMKETDLLELRAKYDIFARIELVPAGWDVVLVHCLGYCTFYTYPFMLATLFSFFHWWRSFVIFIAFARLISHCISISS